MTNKPSYANLIHMLPTGEIEQPENERLNTQLTRYYDQFKTEGYSSSPIPLITWEVPGNPEQPHYLWQTVEYGPKIEGGDDDLFRGYLMSTTDDVPRVLEILSQLGKKLESQDQGLLFKWLGMTNPLSEANVKKYNHYSTGPQVGLGDYRGRTDTMPTAVLYAQSGERIKEILAELAADPKWEQIEKNRIAKFGEASATPIRPTTSIFRDEKLREWRSLNYLPHAGFSDNGSAEPATT